MRLVKQRPATWAMLAFLTLAAEFVLEALPGFGPLLGKIVVPLVACGMLYAAAAADRGERPSLLLAASAFRAPAPAILAVVAAGALTFAAEAFAAWWIADVNLLARDAAGGELSTTAIAGIYTIGVLASLPLTFVPFHVLFERVAPGAAFAASWQRIRAEHAAAARLCGGVAGAAGLRHPHDGHRPRAGAAAVGGVVVRRVEGRVRRARAAAGLSAGDGQTDGRRRNPVAGSTAASVTSTAVTRAAGGPCRHHAMTALDRRRLALHVRLDAARRGGCAPSPRPQRVGSRDHRVAIAHALHAAADDEPPRDHSRYPTWREYRNSAVTVFASVMRPRSTAANISPTLIAPISRNSPSSSFAPTCVSPVAT